MDHDVFHDEEGEVLDLDVKQDAPVQVDEDIDLNGRQDDPFS